MPRRPATARPALTTGIALAAGIALLALACVLPCGPLGDWSAGGIPYQDATPEMLQQQAAENARTERLLRTRLLLSTGVGLLGLATVAYALLHRHRTRRRPAPRPSQPES